MLTAYGLNHLLSENEITYVCNTTVLIGRSWRVFADVRREIEREIERIERERERKGVKMSSQEAARSGALQS